MSVVCSTLSMTATGSSLTGLESGSDFISRGNSNSFRVIFPAGISTATCDVKVGWGFFWQRGREVGGAEVTYLVSWCFEPSQPQRIISGLRMVLRGVEEQETG